MKEVFNDKAEVISVVMPVYNAEKFVEKAIKSIVRQTYTSWELVIVENGSTDNTWNICSKFLNDNRICLIHSDKGVSIARNKGIDYAHGKWIVFLDADDFLTEEALQKFIECVNEETDLVVGDYDYNSKKNGYFDIKDNEKFLAECLANPTQYCNVTANMFSTRFLRKHGIRFNTNLHHAEDSEFFVKCLIAEPAIIKLNNPVYHVFYNPLSTVRKHQKKYVESYVEAILAIKKIMPVSGEKICNAFYLFTLNQLFIILVHDVFSEISDFKSYKTACKKLKEVLSISVFRESLDVARILELPKTKVFVVLALRAKMYSIVLLAVKIRQKQNELQGKHD